MNLSAVPVLMYHTVKYRRRTKEWVFPHLTIELKDFYRHVRFFNILKTKTFFLDNLYLHLKGEVSLPMNSAILTFDDGYLDNYTFVYPLLKKYKLKATIWVNPDFVDNNDSRLRPTLEDYWDGKISLEELNNYDGFLNWEEMKFMEKSGLVEIQSHTLTHTKYPVSDKIVGFVSPNTKIDWLYWNLFPDDKPYFLTNPKYKIPLGYPIYESEKGNVAVRYEENGELTKALVKFVDENGGENFFKNSDWENILFSLSKKIKNGDGVHYKVETENEYRERIKFEIRESKEILEKKLRKKVNHLCWPFGGKNELTIKLAEEAGYLTTTAGSEKNIFKKKDPGKVDRISLDNPKYQNTLFYLYSLYKILIYKI